MAKNGSVRRKIDRRMGFRGPEISCQLRNRPQRILTVGNIGARIKACAGRWHRRCCGLCCWGSARLCRGRFCHVGLRLAAGPREAQIDQSADHFGCGAFWRKLHEAVKVVLTRQTGPLFIVKGPHTRTNNSPIQSESLLHQTMQIPSLMCAMKVANANVNDAGGHSGSIKALSTGFSEAVALAEAGEVKIIGVTSDERVDAYADAATMKEQGIDTTFVNWRGFFAAPGLPEDKLAMYQSALTKMYDTPEWEAVRARNGWVNIHNSGDDFKSFLEGQEQVIGDLMKKLGFL